MEIREVESLPLAFVRTRCGDGEFGAVIPPAYDELYAELAKQGVETAGPNVIVYPDRVFNLEVGVVVSADFEAVGALERRDTPAGRVVTLRHVGAYAGLPAAHRRLHDWCSAEGHAIDGFNWEVYGDWSDDPSELVTDVFYRLP